MKKLWKVCTLALSFLMLFTVAGCGGQSSDQVTLRVYNWGDYIDEDVLAQFEEENPDIHVVYDTFDSNESMLAKMDGGVQYDVLIPSDYMIEKLIQEDRLAELDLSQIPNYANIDDSFKNLAYDPDNKYSVPYTWGTLGISPCRYLHQKLHFQYVHRQRISKPKEAHIAPLCATQLFRLHHDASLPTILQLPCHEKNHGYVL